MFQNLAVAVLYVPSSDLVDALELLLEGHLAREVNLDAPLQAKIRNRIS